LALREKNILVRHFEKAEIKDYVRITIGAPDEMRTLVKATKSILGIEENIE
jgi:histidinol-phosphate aminotransferase